MYFANNLFMDLYSILLLIIIFVYAAKYDEKDSLQHKLYEMVVLITALMLVIDILSRFDGNPGTIYSIINLLGNFLIYLFNPILPSIWLLYVNYHVFHDEKKIKQWLYPLIAINTVNAIMVVLSQFFGWFYYIDSNNIYHRGPLFLLPASITTALLLASFVFIVVNRKKIEHKNYFALVFFAVPPFACVILSIFFYGISLMLNSVVLSLFIVLLNVQNHSMYTDYLTGVNNRKKLESYMREKVSASTENKTFSAILIDIDNFKSINDSFGHDMGDDALETSAMLLKKCLRSNDFIARFGGDEFYAIMDTANSDDLIATVCRICDNVEKYNDSGSKPYKLSFSMGYALYNRQMKMDEFQKHIDNLMYENKQVNKHLANHNVITKYKEKSNDSH